VQNTPQVFHPNPTAQLRRFPQLLRLGLSLIMTGMASHSARLELEVVDAHTGKPTAFIASITQPDGHAISASTGFPAGFRANGSLSLPLPNGTYRIRVTRGPETRAVDTQVSLSGTNAQHLTLALQRFVNLRQRGWFSGDSHAHMIHGERTIPVNFDDVSLAAHSEDLQYLSLSHAWTLDNATPERLAAELQPRSSPHCQLTWNLEAPKNYYLGDAGRCLGHCWNLGLNGRTADNQNVINLLLAASAPDYASTKPTFANFESHHLIHQQHGAVFYSHPARWWIGPWGGKGGYPKEEKKRISNLAAELPLDTLIGPTYDGIDVITSAGELGANEQALQIWYLLLNHGYELAATGSSDACFDRAGGAVPGSVRTYSYLTEPFSLPAITRATAAGHTFVTTGPLLVASLNNQPPGSTLPVSPKPANLQIEAWASGSATNSLDRIEVVRNGKILHRFQVAPHQTHWSTNTQLSLAQPGWFHIRAYASGSPAQQRAFTGAFYCRNPDYSKPQPTPAKAHIQILDAKSGNPITGQVTEVQFKPATPSDHASHKVPTSGLTLTFNATRRLRAEAAGYQPQTLSPILDYPTLLNKITSTTAEDLLNWETYDETRKLLGTIALTFQLIPTP
jgi:hypothetical protein